MGATLGVAIFGTLFTSRLAENLIAAVSTHGQQAVEAGITSPDSLTPSSVQAAGDPLKTAIVDAYANSLAPVFWYLVPILAVALVLALFLKEIPLAEVSGMVARGEAVGGEEAERLEAALREPASRESESRDPAAREPELLEADGVKDDDGELAGQRR